MSDEKNNTGKGNSGSCNSGNHNSGDCNRGSHNSGNHNSGDCNRGSHNSGSCNSGYYNSGSCNSGYYNSGYYNSGNRNSGYYNSGDYNSGDCNSGFFNTNEPTVRMFNKETNIKRSEISIPSVELKINEWVPDTKMTDKQKKNDPDFHVKKGTLIRRSYKDAWKLAWSEMDYEIKQEFLNLPNFDADIFEEITGIDVRKNSESCEGKIVEIDGKKYKLSEV